MKIDWRELIEEAWSAARVAHIGRFYDIFEYEFHLKKVVAIMVHFGFSNEEIVAAILHDSVEDGNLTYNKIKKYFGEIVAQIVLAVTDPSDMPNRKQKKAAVYKKIQALPRSLSVKLGDRIANLEMGLRTENRKKLKMYVDEHAEFRAKLHGLASEDPRVEPMWERLEEGMEQASALLGIAYKKAEIA